jgi:hypothetical protein
VSVSFENDKFDITKVRDFITQSPVQGWQVTFPYGSFTDATFICSTNEIWHEVFVYCMMNVDGYTQIVYERVMD